MPAYNTDETLHAILSFYSLTSEGDSLVSDETLEGLGTSRSLLYILFGSIIRMLQPEAERRKRKNMQSLLEEGPGQQRASAAGQAEQAASTSAASTAVETQSESLSSTTISTRSRSSSLSSSSPSSSSASSSLSTSLVSSDVLLKPSSRLGAAGMAETPSGNGTTSTAGDGLDEEAVEGELLLATSATARKSAQNVAAVAHHYHEKQVPQKSLWKLTDFVPDPGYFVAGAIAGGVSRTATAPLDRLKVYLLVNTSKTNTLHDTVGALKSGQFVKALGHAVSPFRGAIRELWMAGGARSFFAGKLVLFGSPPSVSFPTLSMAE